MAKSESDIFTGFSGLKFHIWHEGFMPEYESYHIPQAIEAVSYTHLDVYKRQTSR